MSVLEQISAGIDEGREAYTRAISRLDKDGKDGFYNDPEGAHDGPDGQVCGSELALGDNVDYMLSLIRRGYSGRFNLIYIDPPFFTRSKFNATVTIRDNDGVSRKIRHLAFDDTFERNLECYIRNMTLRLLLMRDLLAADGLLWIHLDWHSSHYVKLVLDELLGEKNFVNEIIWCYKSGGSGKRHFSRKHDSVLVYSVSNKYYIDIPQEKSYNRGFKPYNFKGVREYSDEQGWYTLVNMKDVWNIDMVGRTSAERTGYATQKPLELMRRIIRSGSREGGLVGDFFCGSGSFLEAAQSEGRTWMGCDNEKLAVTMARKRLQSCGAGFGMKYMAETGSEEGRAVITVNSTEALESGKTMFKCSVTEFVPEIDTGYIRMSDRRYVEDVIRNDPLQLIDYIMADGIVAGDDPELMILTSDSLPELTIVDVFGREYSAMIKYN
ncbi:MAG: site-specific DNA-methyltransferase [Clostridiales bacterium]|nr:site-specific DNA-methyltransferase [Clostridiales bacterium]